MSMKARVYILTFLTYASVHMMRMTYSFNKHNLETKFGVGDLFLGFLDALIFITLAIGTFFRYSIQNDTNLTLVCLKTAIPTSLAFSSVPIVSLIQGQNSIVNPGIATYLFLIAGFGLFGFCQFSFFPALITIFSNYFNVKAEGSLVGFWSSKSNVGNIFGFFMANFLVYQIYTKWEVTMIICSIIHISVALLLERLVQNIQNEKEEITTHELFEFMRQKWRATEFKLYILSFSFFKAILYSYELWTPQFLVQSGFGKYSGYVPMVFDISTLFGSYFMGKLYEQNENEGKQHKNIIELIKSFKFCIAALFISLAALLYLLGPPNILMYFGLAIFMGIFLGGVYNSLENGQILSYAKNDPRETDLLSTVNIGLGCLLVGLFQLVIGAVIYLGGNYSQSSVSPKKHNHSLIYVVIAVLGVVAMMLTFFRAYLTEKEKKRII